jgi:hypothetical protein
MENAPASVCCPACQCGRTRRSRTRGSGESLLALLMIRPYRCKECCYRFFRWSIRHKSMAAPTARTTNPRDCKPLTPREAAHGAHAPHADLS